MTDKTTERLKGTAASAIHERDRLKAENTKLRELLVDMWEWMSRARYQRSVREEEMDELGARAVQLGIPDHWLGIEVRS